MKRTLLTVFTASALAFCFALSVCAASVFTISVDGINQAQSENKTIVYTRAYGEKVPSADGEYYVITVVPKFIGDDSSENDIQSNEISELISEEVSDIPDVTMDVSDYSNVSFEVSEIVSEIFSMESVAETAADSNYKYKVENIFTPSDSRENISIPQNGFAVLFRSGDLSGVGENSLNVTSDASAESRNANISDVEIGSPVAVYGIDFNTLSVSEGAYIEIELSEKGLLGDIPQTSDRSMTAIFTVVASLSVLSAAWFYRRRNVA